jgi:hypothetical protein
MVAMDDTAIYDEDDLVKFIQNEGKVTISSNVTEGTRSVKSNVCKKSPEEAYFQELTEQLKLLCEEYKKTMEEMHSLYMEV